MGKPAFCICENKDADQLRGKVTAKLISAFVLATQIVQSLFYLNLKSQASSHLLWLYSLVCVGPGRKPEDRFSHNEAQVILHISSQKPKLSVIIRSTSLLLMITDTIRFLWK